MELFRLFGTIAVNNDEANSAIDETTGIAEQSESRMSGAFKKIGAAVAAAFAVDKIIEFGKSITEAASTVAAEQSAFEQIMGEYSNTAQEKVNEIADATGMVSTRLTPYMTSMTAKFKGLGYDIDDATTLASDGLNIAADAAAFWDMSLDDSMSHLNSFINGSYEGGEAIGLFANDTQMAMYAVQTGLVESTSAWSSLDEATKQATRLEYAQNMMEASGATGQAAKEADQYANVQANLTEKWRQFKAQIGEPLLQNVVLPAMEKLSGIVDVASQKFQEFSQWISENKALLSAIAVVIGIVTTALTLQTAVQGVKAAMNAAEVTTLGALIAAKWADAAATMAALAPYLAIAAAIAAVIAIVVLLVKNWDKLKETATKVWNSITEAVSSAWETIKNVIDVGIKLIASIIDAGFQIIALPFMFIWENCRDTLIGIWNAIVDFLTPILETISNVFSTVWNAISTTITTVLNTIKTVVSNVWNGIKTTISNVVNAVKTTVSNVFNSVKTTVSNVFNGIKTTATTVWNGIKSAIITPIESAKTKIKSIVDTIKGFFSGMNISFPHIKLPHFGITPAGWKIGDLLQGSIPKLKIDWYAKAMDNAMLLDKPTIFGESNGTLLGGGDAGQEVVAGSNTLTGMIRGAVQQETSGMYTVLNGILSVLTEYLPGIPEIAQMRLVMDTGAVVGQLAPAMDSRLGDINRLRGRGQ